jgi:Uma2 family endonuclease
MVDANVFRTWRVELIEGRIYRGRRPSELGMAATSKTSRTLTPRIPNNEWLMIHGTIRLDRFTAPDPDFMWVPAAIGTPEAVRPLPLLVIEVSDKTYRKDSGIKVRKYAQAGIQDYWIENIKANRIEVYRDPQNPTGDLQDCHYASVTHFLPGQSITLLARPHVVLQVSDLLP